jgi:hypothetical protein
MPDSPGSRFAIFERVADDQRAWNHFTPFGIARQ